MRLNGKTILLNARIDTANTVDGLWGLVRYRRHAWRLYGRDKSRP